MTTVNNKKEYIQALKNGETEFYVKNKRLLLALTILSKVKSRKEIVAVAAGDIGARQRVAGAVGAVATTTVTITIIVAILAVSMFAIHKGNYIEVDWKEGKVKLTPSNTTPVLS